MARAKFSAASRGGVDSRRSAHGSATLSSSPRAEPIVCMTPRWREMDSNFQFRAGSAPFRRSERSEHGIWAQGAQWLTGAPIYPLSNEALLPERTGCRDRFGAG